MTVPFERLGPGQVGRLAYQVIGKDGPIFNPSSISYLSPRDVQSSAFMSPTAAVAGLAGLNLAASVGAIAISAVVLREVRQVHRQLDVVEAQLTDLAVSLADVQARVQRIDTRVSETHLREALRHCLSSSVVGDGIDLSRLVPLIEDIQSIEETLEGGLLFNFGVRLSSDLRDQLHLLLSMLCNLRRNIVGLHNRAVACVPEKMVHFKSHDDYFAPQTTVGIVDAAIAIGRAEAAFNSFGDVLGQTAADQSYFGGEKKREQFQLLLVEEFYKPYLSAMNSSGTTAFGLQLQETLSQIELDFADEDAEKVAIDVFHVWFAESDASLLHRVRVELMGIQDGYATVFYPGLVDQQNVPLKSTVFSLRHEKA